VVSFILPNSPQRHKEPEEVSAALLQARSLIDGGKPGEAIEKLQAMKSSADPRIEYLLGVACYHADKPVRAIELLTSSLGRLSDGSSEKREATQVLGLSHYLAGHLAESIPYLEKTLAWAPDNTDLSYILGMAYTQTRQPAKARESFARLFRVAPDSPAAHLFNGQMMIRGELWEIAEDELKQALQKDPKLPETNFLLGQIAIYRGNLDQGVSYMERELEVNPGNSMAHYRMGDAYTREQKWEEAIAALQKSVWLNPYFSGPYILLGKSYLKKSLPVKAEGVLRRAIQFDPNNKSAHYLLAQTLQQLNRPEDARREFETAERLHGEIIK
jgi:tetratricopeptide (TPR) repeat protein